MKLWWKYSASAPFTISYSIIWFKKNHMSHSSDFNKCAPLVNLYHSFFLVSNLIIASSGRLAVSRISFPMVKPFSAMIQTSTPYKIFIYTSVASKWPMLRLSWTSSYKLTKGKSKCVIVSQILDNPKNNGLWNEVEYPWKLSSRNRVTPGSIQDRA